MRLLLPEPRLSRVCNGAMLPQNSWAGGENFITHRNCLTQGVAWSVHSVVIVFIVNIS